MNLFYEEGSGAPCIKPVAQICQNAFLMQCKIIMESQLEQWHETGRQTGKKMRSKIISGQTIAHLKGAVKFAELVRDKMKIFQFVFRQ